MCAHHQLDNTMYRNGNVNGLDIEAVGKVELGGRGLEAQHVKFGAQYSGEVYGGGGGQVKEMQNTSLGVEGRGELDGEERREMSGGEAVKVELGGTEETNRRHERAAELA